MEKPSDSDLLETCTPGGKRVLQFDATKISNDILRILMAKGFTVEEMELVFSLTRYRVTGTLTFPKLEKM